MVGNFPQAFSHLALIGAAVTWLMSQSHLLDNLELMHAETLALLSTAARLDDASITAPSLCEGLRPAPTSSRISPATPTRSPTWCTGRPPASQHRCTPPLSPATPTRRRFRRPAADQVADLVASAARLAEMAPSLAGPPEDREVEMRGGRIVPVVTCHPAAAEVVFHHVDLDLGYTFADADAGFVERTLRRAVATLAEQPGRAVAAPAQRRG